MNYNMYSNRRNDNIDPNYIYPQPYIDPLMYMNPYVMNNNQSGNFNQNINPEYSTYSNQYVDTQQFNPYENMPNNMQEEFENNNNMNDMNNIPMIPMMPPNMMFPGMFPPNMMYPGVMQNIPTVNMDEFDEEEM